MSFFSNKQQTKDVRLKMNVSCNAQECTVKVGIDDLANNVHLKEMENILTCSKKEDSECYETLLELVE